MTFRIERDESPTAGVQRVVTETIDACVGRIDDQDVDEHEVVHDVRRVCKQLRAVLRLIHGSAAPAVLQQQDRRYREIGRALAELRDAHAHVESFDALLARTRGGAAAGAFDVIRETLEDRRDELEDELGIDRRLAAARRSLLEARDDASRLGLDATGFDAFDVGLRRTYVRAQDRFVDAYEHLTPHAFHEWRKRAKDHRHHAELLGLAWPDAEALEDLHDLTDLLGDDHDLAQLAATLRTEPERFPDGPPTDEALVLIEWRRGRLQREAEPLGAALLAPDPDQLVAAVREGWEAAAPSRVPTG